MIPDQTRRVLLGLSEVLPEAGHNVLTAIDMRKGWGDTIFVTVRSGIPRRLSTFERQKVWVITVPSWVPPQVG
jgi:hypothetical protein